MMTDAEYLSTLVMQLTDGWTERIEYNERVTVHVKGCNKKGGKYKRCLCPEAIEARAKTSKQMALLAQLAQANTLASSDGGYRSSGKPGSRPPGDLTAVELLYKIRITALYCRNEMWMEEGKDVIIYKRTESLANVLRDLVVEAIQIQYRYPSVVRSTSKSIHACIREVRILLGYDAPSRKLRDTVCGSCGGVLRVAADARSDVWCTGTPDTPPCGTVYRQWQWLDLLPA